MLCPKSKQSFSNSNFSPKLLFWLFWIAQKDISIIQKSEFAVLVRISKGLLRFTALKIISNNLFTINITFRKTTDDEEGGAAIYGMAQTFSDRSMVDLMARAYLDSMYSTKADLQ